MNMEFMKDWRPSSVKLVVVEDGGTNIEHQENHYGNGRDDEKIANAEPEMPGSITDKKIAACIMALNTMAEDELFVHKQDFGAILRMMRDKMIFEKITTESFVEQITNNCTLCPKIKPTVSSVKNITISAALHPNWKIAGADITENRRIVELAETFFSLYNTYK